MTRETTLLNGIQSSGMPHLGNILGSLLPSIELIDEGIAERNLFFIADLHALTTEKNLSVREQNTFCIVAVLLALGLDLSKVIVFRQSYVPRVCELAWYLSCYTPYPMLANAHAFKDKSQNLADVNIGLFTYPVLMAADILLYNADYVPIGKDQIQHIEIARDIAQAFNRMHDGGFVVPEYIERVASRTIPGTDGRKMSKSYKNTINIFAKEEELKKEIMSIKTASTLLHQAMDFENCNVYNIYKELASEESQLEMQEKYRSENYGFADAKRELLNLILNKFEKQREIFSKEIESKHNIYAALDFGEKQATRIADDTMSAVKLKTQYFTKK